jgi:hypothetical protein
MDDILQNLLTQLGITGSLNTLLFFILREIFSRKAESIRKEQAELTELRKSERDAQHNSMLARFNAQKEYGAGLEASLGTLISQACI